MTRLPDTLLRKDLPHDIAESIAQGRHNDMLCPACLGGRSGERKLSYYRNGEGVGRLHCFRAGCGYWAIVVDTPGDSEMLYTPEVKPRPFHGETEHLRDEHEYALSRRYGIERGARFRLASVVGRDAIYMPVLGPSGEDRGGMVRYLDGTTPKAVSYLTTVQPKLAWFRSLEHRGIVVVEDHLSAIRCAQLGYDGVALMGTNLSTAQEDEIRRVGEASYDAPRVALALDKDAFGKACKYAQRWPALAPVLLEHDIKDSHDDDVRARLNQIFGG